MTTLKEAFEDIATLTPAKLQEAAIIAEAKAAQVLAELHDEPAYELSGRLTGAAELLRARNTFRARAAQIVNFGPTELEPEFTEAG